MPGWTKPMELLLFIVLWLSLSEQSNGFSNAGREFHLGFFRNRLFAKNPLAYILVTVADQDGPPIPFTVEIPKQDFSVESVAFSGRYSRINLPSKVLVTRVTPPDRAIVVKATPGSKGDLVVVGMNEDEASTDAYLGLPVLEYTSSVYEYVAFSTRRTSLIFEGNSVVLLVASEDNTVITVTPTQDSFIPIRRPRLPKGIPRTFVLNRLGMAQMYSEHDLTGSYINSTKPLSVFVGHECGNVPFNQSSCDHLLEQIPPADSWGLTYYTSPLISRTSGDLFKLVASRDNTNVKMSCIDKTNSFSREGEFKMSKFQVQSLLIGSSEYCRFQGNLPIFLVQYSLGHSVDRTLFTDPFISIVQPYEQYIGSYSVVAIKGDRLLFRTYANLMIPSHFYQPDNLTIDGVSLTDYRKTREVVATEIDFESQDMVALTLPLASGSHFFRHTSQYAIFSVSVYGYSDQMSYGYPAGFGLSPISVSNISLEVETVHIREDKGPYTVEVRRTGLMGIPATVTVVTQEVAGGARTNKDFLPLNEVVSFAAGEKYKTVSVAITDNSLQNELRRPFKVVLLLEKLQPGVALVPEKSSVEVVILDNDIPVVIEMVSKEYVVSEGDLKVLRIGVRRRGFIAEDIVISLKVKQKIFIGQDGDIEEPKLIKVVFNASSENETEIVWVEVPITDDDVVAGNRKFLVQLILPEEVRDDPNIVLGVAQTADISVLEDDVVVFEFENTTITTEEDKGKVVVCVKKIGNTTLRLTVGVTSSFGSARDGTDFMPVNKNLVFEPSESRKCLDIILTDDEVAENLETFSLGLVNQNGENARLANGSKVDVNIVDDDTVSVGFKDDVVIGNEGGPARICVTVSGSVQNDLLFNLTLTGGNASYPADGMINLPGVRNSKLLIIPTGASQSCFDVGLSSDGLAETNEFFELGLVHTDMMAVPITITRNRTTLIIRDADLLIFAVTGTASVKEGENTTICVRKTGSTDNIPVSVIVGLVFSSDPSYLPANLTKQVDFSPGQREACTVVALPNDTVAAGAIVLEFGLTQFIGEVRHFLRAGTFLINVADDERVSVGFSLAQYVVEEGDGKVTVCLSVPGEFRNQETVRLSVSIESFNTNATIDNDYTSLGGSVNVRLDLGLGEKSECFDLDILDDSVHEPDEVVGLVAQLGPESPQVKLSPRRTSVLIMDDDNVTLKMKSSRLGFSESDAFAQVCIVKVGTTTLTLMADMTAQNGSALLNEDYGFRPVTVQFSPADTEQCLFLPILNNFIIEPVESFFVELSAIRSPALRAFIGSPQRTEIFIADDDVAVIEFEETEIRVSEGEGFDREVCLLKEGVSLQPITVTVAAEGLPVMNTASPSEDLVSSQISFTFAPNATKVCRPLRVIDDSVVEYNEKLLLTISVPLAGLPMFKVGNNAESNVTINDDDSVMFMYNVDILTIIEGEGPKTLCVTIKGSTAINILYNVTNLPLTATAGEDYEELQDSLLVFGPTTSERCIEVVVIDDNDEEPEEMFLVMGVYRSNSGDDEHSNTAMITILDDDSLRFNPEVVGEVPESVGSVEVCLRKTGNTAKNFTFNIATSGSAQDGLDYVLNSTALTILTDSTVECFSVGVTNDNFLERDETVNLTFSSADGPDVLAVFTINNDDSAEISFQSSAYQVNESETEVVLNVAIVGSVAIPLPFSLLLFPVTADTGDFVVVNVSKPLALFTDLEKIPVPIIDDLVPEGDETFRAVLMVPQESADAGLILSLTDREAIVTIKDDDVVTVKFTSNTYNVSEGDGVLVVTVESDVAADNDLSLGITVTEGTAKFGSDIVQREIVVVIETGSTQGEGRIALVNDQTAETLKDFTMSLSIMTPNTELLAALGQPNQATVRIFDDDVPSVEFDRDVYVVVEGDRTATLKLVSTRVAAYDVGVLFDVTSLSASEGADFVVASSSPLTISAGMTETSLVVTIISDTVFEGNKTLEISLTSLTASANLRTPPSLGARRTARVVIVEDDQKLIVSFEKEKYSVSEDVRAVDVCLVTEGLGRPTQSMTIPLNVTGLSAEEGVDFRSPDPPSVTFSPGQSRSCLTVNITDDSLEESVETFKVAFPNGGVQGLPQGVEPGRINQSGVMITDNDDPLRQCIVNTSRIVPFHKLSATSPLSYPMGAPCEHVLASSCGFSSMTRVRIHADFSGDRFGVLLVRISTSTVSVFPNGSYSIFNQTSVGDATSVDLTITSSNGVVVISAGDIVVARNTVGGDVVNITIQAGSFRLCGLCGNGDGSLRSRSSRLLPQSFSASQRDSFIKSWRLEEEDALIPVTRQECATMRNDSMILDPLLTVPIYVHEAPGTKFRKAALCYEIRGHSNAIYNLVSDSCVAVNGEFVQMPSPWQHLNTLGAVGMVAIDNKGHCMSLTVRHNGDCVATINNQPVLTSYHQNGISVTKSPGNVRIKVPDCEHVDLTMWVMCQKIEGLNMMKYVVTRGLNMHPTSHGLIGQFWNVPITIRKANDTNFNDVYKVVVQPQESAHRSFYAEYNRHTWSGERKPCLYAGTSQGNRHTNDRDSVIEGHVSNYHVHSLHSMDYVFSKFESSRCEAGSS